MSNAKVATAYAAKLYRDAMTGRLNADTSDTTQLLNEAFAKAFEAYKSDREDWVGLTNEEIGGLTVFDGLHHVSTPLLAEFIKSIEAKLKDKNQ